MIPLKITAELVYRLDLIGASLCWFRWPRLSGEGSPVKGSRLTADANGSRGFTG